MSACSPDLVRDWVARTCQAQGLEVEVTDDTVLGRVAAIVRQSALHPSAARHLSGRRPAASPGDSSDAPSGLATSSPTPRAKVSGSG